MNKKSQIVCIAPTPWENLPQRSQELMSIFPDAQILYFSPPYPYHKKAPFHKKRVKTNIFSYILPKDIHRIPNSNLLRTVRQRRLAQYITRTMAKHHFRSPILWVTHPSQEEMTCYLNYQALVYDCHHPPDQEYKRAEEYLLRKADVVFAASRLLKERIAYQQRNVILLENGLHTSTFHRASLFARLDPTEKRFGFAGVIDYHLDLSPLVYMAQKEPQWQFMLLGPCPQGNPYLSRLKTYNNVKFYGEHPLHVVPEFLFSCHVLLDFCYENQNSYDIHSSRHFEYLATGRPIVVQRQPSDPDIFQDVMYTAYCTEDYYELCREALAESPDPRTALRKDYAQEASWKNRITQVEDVFHSWGL